MNKENTQKLLQSFPRLYRSEAEGARETQMHWGFQCGDGWFRLIYDLSAEIESEAVKLGLDPESDEWPLPAQIKEKFGTLRYYMRVHFESIFDIIAKYEDKSEHTCESCGLAGTLRRDGWHHVSCDPCEEKIRAGVFRQ